MNSHSYKKIEVMISGLEQMLLNLNEYYEKQVQYFINNRHISGFDDLNIEQVSLPLNSKERVYHVVPFLMEKNDFIANETTVIQFYEREKLVLLEWRKYSNTKPLRTVAARRELFTLPDQEDFLRGMTDPTHDNLIRDFINIGLKFRTNLKHPIFCHLDKALKGDLHSVY